MRTSYFFFLVVFKTLPLRAFELVRYLLGNKQIPIMHTLLLLILVCCYVVFEHIYKVQISSLVTFDPHKQWEDN